MSVLKIAPRITVALLLVLLATCGQTYRLDVDAINNAEIRNLSAHEELVFASGQPTQEQVQVLASAGVRHIINLRPAAEQDWNEAALVQSLGMEYHSIPVSGASGVTSENAQSLSELLASLDGAPVLVHCASSNRVGALVALSALESEGLSVEEALARGRSWGLTGMEPAVREILSD